MRATFITWDGGGNEPPAVAAADALVERGHDVPVLGYESQRVRLYGRAFDFAPLRRASAEFSTQPWPRPMPAIVMASEAQIVDVREVLGTRPTDVVVVDCLLFGALAAVESLRVPTVVLVHSPAGLLVPRGGLLDRVLPEYVNTVRKFVALPAISTLRETWVTGSIVATTVREMDPQPSDDATYVGRVVPRFPTAVWSWPWDADDQRPLVVASFTTGGAWDQTSRIERTLEALRDLPLRLLVTTAGLEIEPRRIPANAALIPFIPHDAVLPDATLMITHAGHGTVLASLAHGVPLVCLPNPLSDQPAVAARVEQLGAGVALDPESATAAQLRDAVTRVLATPSYTESARRLQPSIAAAPGATGVADAVERVARDSRPTASWPTLGAVACPSSRRRGVKDGKRS